MAPNDNRPTDEFDLSTGQGFERFVLACQTRVFRFLRSKGVNTHDAEELCQDAILTLWQNRHKPRNPQTFVIGIANRLAMAYHRKRLRLQTVGMDEASAEAHAVPAADAVPTRAPPALPALPPALVALLDTLTRRQRQVIDLFRLQGFTRRGRRPPTRALRFHEKRAQDRLRVARSGNGGGRARR